MCDGIAFACQIAEDGTVGAIVAVASAGEILKRGSHRSDLGLSHPELFGPRQGERLNSGA